MSTQLLADAARRATAYLATLPDRHVEADPAAVARLAELTPELLPDAGADPAALLAALDEIGSPATVGSAGPRYFGFVTGGSLPPTVAAQWLASAWDQNGAMRVMSPVAVHLEEAAHRWLIALLGLPPECAAATTTGAQMANFTALAAARHALLARAGWNVERDGLFGAPPVHVVVSEQSHSTVGKALAMLGLGRGRVTTVPADAQGRVEPSALLQAVTGPAIVCLQAGNVNTGAFDDFAAVMPHLRQHGAWVHIDGAFGLWAAASPAHAHLMHSAAGADSWATDGHKTLNVPYDCGLAFVRDAAALHAAMSISGAYIASAEFSEPLWRSPDASRRARAVELWMAMRYLGNAGIASLVSRLCNLARRMADRLTDGGLEVLNHVVFNQVLVRLNPAAMAAIQKDGICWCGGTQWQGRPAMRISVSNWSTSEADIDRAAQAILQHGVG